MSVQFVTADQQRSESLFLNFDTTLFSNNRFQICKSIFYTKNWTATVQLINRRALSSLYACKACVTEFNIFILKLWYFLIISKEVWLY